MYKLCSGQAQYMYKTILTFPLFDPTVPNCFEIHAILYKLWSGQIRMEAQIHGRTHIHRTKIVTTMSRQPASGLDKNYPSIIIKYSFLPRALEVILNQCCFNFKMFNRCRINAVCLQGYIMIDGWMDRQMDGWMERWMDGCMDGQMDGWTDRWRQTDG